MKSFQAVAGTGITDTANVSTPCSMGAGFTDHQSEDHGAGISHLAPRLRCRIQVAVASVLQCQYSLQQAVAAARQQGLNGLEVDANAKGASLDARAELAIQFALHIAQKHENQLAEQRSILSNAGYSLAEITEIKMLVEQHPLMQSPARQ